MGNLRLTPTQDLNQAGRSGYGSLLTVERETGTAFPGTIMGALMGITAINVRTNVIPSYHMRSLGRFQSFSPGLRDGGEIAAAVNWLPGLNDTQGRGAAEWSLLRQATLESNELTKIRVFAPDPDLHMIRVNGFLTQLGPFSYQPEAIMSGQVGWKIVGAPDIITPIVYQVSDYVFPTPAGDATGTVLTRLNPMNSSDAGSIAAGVLVGGGYNRLIVPTLAINDDGDGVVVTLTGGAGLADDNTGDSELRVRAYLPGEFELWTDEMTADGDAAKELGAADAGAEGVAFISRLKALGNPPFFLAIYGAAQL